MPKEVMRRASNPNPSPNPSPNPNPNPNPRSVYAWREQAEQERRARGEGAMDAEQVRKFVDRYYPSYEQYLPALYAASPCAEERTLRYWIDADRRPCRDGPPGGVSL